MRTFKLFILIVSALSIDTVFSQTECMKIQNKNGKLEMSATGIRRGKMQKTCWNVIIPSGSTATFNVTKLTTDRTEGVTVYLKINDRELKPQILDSNNLVLKENKDVTVTHFVENHSTFFPVTSVFEATYAIKAEEENETDDEDETDDKEETKEETETVAGLKEMRAKLISWLKDQRFENGGWRKDSPKAMIAIHLATGTNFRENSEERKMATDMKMELYERFLGQNELKIDDLTEITNALIAICEEPNEFGRKKIVDSLITEVAEADNKSNGAAYLALCNADKELSDTSAEDLASVLDEEDKKKQAFAIMALACERRRKKKNNQEFSAVFNDTIKAVTKAVRNLKDQQRREGHFGDLTSTIEVTQALLSWGERTGKGWNYTKAIQYLMKRHKDDITFDFETVCNLLPILNGKTLVDVSCKKEYFVEKIMNTSDEYYPAEKLLENSMP